MLFQQQQINLNCLIAANSQLCLDNADLRQMSDELVSVVYQMGHNTEDMVQLAHRTVREPIKKINNEYPHIQAAIRRRDLALQEAQRAQAKYEKLAKLEKNGANNAKREQARRCYVGARDDFDKANKMLLLELPQFYERRIEYFQPSLQALVRAQVDYYGCSTRLHSKLGHSASDNTGAEAGADTDYSDSINDIEKKLSEIRALSIVGS